MISNDNDDNGTIEVVTTELDTNTYQDRLDRELMIPILVPMYLQQLKHLLGMVVRPPLTG